MPKKAAKQQDANYRGLPNTLPFYDPDEDAARARETSQGNQTPDLTALQRQIAELEAGRKQDQRNLAALLAQPSYANQRPMVNTELDTKGLPDPIQEPDAYAREMTRRMNQAIEARQQVAQYEQAQQQSQAAKVNALWEDFSEKYPDYADKYDQVEFAARKVVSKAQAKGMDVNKYMFGASGIFMEDVASELEKVFGSRAEDTDTDPEPEDDGSDDGSVGVFGGSASGGKPVAPQVEGGDMFDDLKEWQIKTGFYR